MTITPKARVYVLLLIALLVCAFPGKIESMASSFAGWGDDARREYDEQVKLNDAYLADAQKLEMENRHDAGFEAAARAQSRSHR